MERWKPIPNTNRKYSVSDLGRVKSNVTKQILKTNYRINGCSIYERIQLSINGKKKCFYIHVLVKTTFEPIDDLHLYHIDHRSNCCTDNRLSNLQYLLIEENLKKKIKTFDSYKLYKNLIQVFGEEEVFKQLKTLKYNVENNKKNTTETVLTSLQSSCF